MRQLIYGLFLAVMVIAAGPAGGQTAAPINGSVCASGASQASSLYCLFPLLYSNATPNPFAAITSSFASQLTQVPLASPASGIIYVESPSLKIPVRSGQETFGPVLTERADTLGSRKLFVAVTYQFFEFNSLDGISLKAIPVVFNACNGNGQCDALGTTNRVDLKVNQTALFATYGILRNLDVSIALPLNDVHLAAAGISCIAANPNCKGTYEQVILNSAARSAGGIGDVVIRGKIQFLSREKFKLAGGADVRFSSGNEFNFLGSGATGVKPFVVVSRNGRLSPHVYFAYQWNGSSLLGGAALGVKAPLASAFSYAIGADYGASKKITLALDFLGDHVTDQLRLRPIQTLIPGLSQPVSDVAISRGNFWNARGSGGAKYNPWKGLIVSGNLYWSMDHNGLRNGVVPLGGVSYVFGREY